MKTLFAANDNFTTSTFELLSGDELLQVRGGGDPGDVDLFWEDELTKP